MVDTDGLSEAQLRFIVNYVNEVSDDVWFAMEEDDYPQNNEEIKKIKIINKGTDPLDNIVLRDTTIGNEYLVTFTAQGTACPDGIIAKQDSLSFKDDVDDWVSIFVADETYEVVACHEESVDE